MDLTLFWSVFVGFGILYFAVGMYASRNVATEEEYFLAGRKFGVTAITLTLIATQLGAGMVLGTSEEAFRFGYYGIFYNVGICLGFLLLGFGFASKLRKFNISTTAELFELKYNSVLLRRLASLLSVLTLGGILAGQILASRKLIGTFTHDFDWLITGFWLLVISYTMFGGLKAVVATDIFQVIVIILIFGTVFAYVILSQGSAIPSMADMTNLQDSYFDTDTVTFSKLTGFLLMPIFFSLIEQDLAQRFFSARSKQTAVVAAFFAGIFIMLFSFVPLYFGMKAKMLAIPVAHGASPLLAVVGHLAGDVALVFMVCGLIAAISSTADSLLCAIGSNIIYDFNVAPSDGSQSYAILLSRAVTLVVGIGALVTAYFFDSVLGIITQSYELSVSCLFIPLFFCFFKKRVHKEAAAAAFIGGLFGFLAFRAFPISMPREIATLILSLVCYLAGDTWARMQERQAKLMKA
jgi:SSS family solute:Na+ symporter